MLLPAIVSLNGSALKINFYGRAKSEETSAFYLPREAISSAEAGGGSLVSWVALP
jgi:hypothetical protein